MRPYLLRTRSVVNVSPKCSEDDYGNFFRKITFISNQWNTLIQRTPGRFITICRHTNLFISLQFLQFLICSFRVNHQKCCFHTMLEQSQEWQCRQLLTQLLLLEKMVSKREKHPLRNVTFSKFAGFYPATLLKVALLHGCFSRFLNCTNGTKSRNTLHIWVCFELLFSV